jgi:predicted HAD superfamily Cof-like phosphohydrolase
MSKSNFRKVQDFSNAFGVKKYDIFNKNVLEDKENNNLRISLIIEEFNETDEARKQKDVIEVRDGFADQLYVLYGMADSFGIDIDREIGNRIKSNYFNNLEFLKYFTTKNYEVFNIKVLEDTEFINPIFKNLSIKIKLLEMCVIEKNSELLINKLCEIIYMIYKIAKHFGITIHEDFSIVHNSNMSKICKTEEEAIKTVKKYETDERYPEPYYEKNDYGYIVKNRTTGKVLKSINYIPAKFN